MKLKFLFLLSTILLLLTAATAERYINYDFKQGIISESGQLTQTNTPLTNVHVLGYECLDPGCTTIGEEIFRTNSGSSDTLQLIFPTDLKSIYGYAVYYYKPGYITWEQNPNWYGTNLNDPQGPFTKYLSKKQNCHAPIESFSMINDAEPNIPLYITALARLDAETYSALFHNGPLEYIPPELQNYYQVQTEIHLAIYDDQNILVHFDKQELFIDFSGSENIQFTWTPVLEGDYKAVLTSIITDPKCSSPQQETVSKEFTVLDSYPQDLCYTILNDLETSNKFPDVNELLTINFTKISNYIDNIGTLTPLPTLVTYELRAGKDDQNGNLVYTQQYTLPSSSIITPELIEFNWVMPSQIGWYTIYITGECSSPICDIVGNIPDKISESIYLGVLSNYAPLITSSPKTSALVDELYIYDVNAEDKDNDPLTYTLTNYPEGMAIDNTTGLINWTPTTLGTYNIAIRVEDPYDGYDTQIYNLEVVPETPVSKKHLFSIGSISLPTNTYNEGNIIDGLIQLRNIGQKKEKNIAVYASILDLGVETIVTQNLNLGQHDNKYIPFELELPYNMKQGEYLLRIEITNKHYKEIKHIPIYINDRFIFNF